MLAGDYQRIATASDAHCCPMSHTSYYRGRGLQQSQTLPLHKLYGDLMRLTQAGVKSAQHPHHASEIAQAAI
jgi:hypothetical protein